MAKGGQLRTCWICPGEMVLILIYIGHIRGLHLSIIPQTRPLCPEVRSFTFYSAKMSQSYPAQPNAQTPSAATSITLEKRLEAGSISSTSISTGEVVGGEVTGVKKEEAATGDFEELEKQETYISQHNPRAFPDGGAKAWLCVLGAFCCLFCSFGNFQSLTMMRDVTDRLFNRVDQCHRNLPKLLPNQSTEAIFTEYYLMDQQSRDILHVLWRSLRWQNVRRLRTAVYSTSWNFPPRFRVDDGFHLTRILALRAFPGNLLRHRGKHDILSGSGLCLDLVL
jgi:hypothetical protein